MKPHLWIAGVCILMLGGSAFAQPVKPEGLTVEQFEKMVERIIPADMRQPLEKIKPEDNAWPEWEIILKAMAAADIEARQYFNQLVAQTEPLTDEQWTWVADYVAFFDKHLAHIKRGLKRPKVCPPTGQTLNDAPSPLGDLRLAAELLMMRSRLNERERDATAAVADAVTAMQIGYRFGRDGQTMIDGLVGAAFLMRACHRMRELCGSSEVQGADELQKIIKAMKEVDLPSIIAFMHRDFVNDSLPSYLKYVVAFQPDAPVAAKREAAFELAFGGFWMAGLSDDQKSAANDWLLANLTLFDADAELKRDRRIWGTASHDDWQLSEPDDQFLDVLMGGDLKRVFTPLVEALKDGRMLDAEASAELAKAAQQVIRKRRSYTWVCDRFAVIAKTANADIDATRVIVACRIYQLRHGKLPETLASLVDEKLIESVPTDPFDGKPLRYDATRGVIWSVGTNRTDEGGKVEQSEGSALLNIDYEDIVWKMPFVEMPDE